MEHNETVERGVIPSNCLRDFCPTFTVNRRGIKELVKLVDCVSDTFAVFTDWCSKCLQLFAFPFCTLLELQFVIVL